jgi:hypothetical protein
MISSIYGSNKAMYKVGERKGKTKAEIQKLENLKTKKKKVIPKKKPNMNSGIKTFNQAQEIKVEVTEYPGYFINMAGLVCYKHGNGYRYCKKADKQSVYVIVDGKQTLVNEVELADKYVPGWTKYRKVKVKKENENKPFTTDSLERIVEANKSKVIEILINQGYQISKVIK